MKTTFRILLFSFLTLFVVNCSSKNKTVTFKSMLEDMTDPLLLSEYPEPGFTCRQFSSYDRRSVAPDQEGWFANADASWFLREETNGGRREFVMMDAAGPGAVVRFWMTFGNEQAYTGTLRFYFDGQATPEIEGPVLEIISGGKLTNEPLSSSVSPLTPYAQRGHNLYLPIPYANSLKITYECSALDPVRHSPSVYYNINYRTYESGTAVKSFTLADLIACKDERNTLSKKLLESVPEVETPLEKRKLADHPGQILEPGKSLRMEIRGPAAINELTVNIKAEDQPQAFRSTILQITFDGERTVWSPVGDFFGTGYQLRPYKTYHTAARESGDLHSFWIMPFRRNAVVEIINQGNQQVIVQNAEALTSPYKWSKRSMHFGAVWHEYNGIDAKGYTGDHINGVHEDINFVTLEGVGQYVGDAITIFNTADAWWGEGDEKVYVDGELLPSHIGTGTEDYIGYAWCRPEVFSHFLIAQPDGSGNFHPGMTVNMRHRLLDAIPFTSGVRFDMELWHWATTRMNYGIVSYWYLKPGGKCLISPKSETVNIPVSLKRENLYPPVPDSAGYLQGEHLRIVSLSSGTWETQNSGSWGWSNNAQLWWMDGGTNGKLKAEFELPQEGNYQITLNFTKAVDYGNFRILINDQAASQVYNAYHENSDNPVVTEKASLGAFELNKGTNTIQVEIKGKHPEAIARYMVGIDYLRLEKAVN